MRPHGGKMPGVDEVGRGDVKTPPLWHTVAKMPSGRWYSDGSFHGRVPLMASSMELEKDRSFDALVEHVIPTIKGEFDSVIRHLRPPPYPYAIDSKLAARGRDLFYSPRIGCHRCHGRYDGQGNVDWPGVHADVGTDRARLRVVSDAFIDAFKNSPIADGRGADQEPRLCSHPADRGLGQLSVSPQRQRAHVCITCSDPSRSGHASSTCRPRASSIAIVSDSSCFAIPLTHARAKWSSSGSLARIATGSIAGAKGRATAVTTSGGRFRPTPTDAR